VSPLVPSAAQNLADPGSTTKRIRVTPIGKFEFSSVALAVLRFSIP